MLSPSSLSRHRHHRRRCAATNVAAQVTAGRRLAVRPLSIAAPDRRCRLLRRHRRCGTAPPAALCLALVVRRWRRCRGWSCFWSPTGVRRVRGLAPRREPRSAAPLVRVAAPAARRRWSSLRELAGSSFPSPLSLLSLLSSISFSSDLFFLYFSLCFFLKKETNVSSRFVRNETRGT
ncbi:hypothetical protein Scep_028208 [Stephania cephalantha]|uniref:Uncharacterized protein n=1 Tax=Stephania cephalantha TaxID=152367 RepID=A0AAP0E9I7_9MAGN